MREHLISVAELDRRKGGDIVILDCRFALSDTGLGQRQYEAGHIPGAVYMHLDDDLAGPTGKHGGRHPLPPLGEITSKLRAAGVNNESRVVCYDDSRFAFASRAWWLLRFLGHGDTVLLNGGYQAWLDAGHPVETDTPVPKPGNFSSSVQADRVVGYEAVARHSLENSACLIDSREAPRYQGLEEPIDPVAGHIPGAVNYPWPEVTDERGMARPPAVQEARWRDLPTDKDLIFYCGSGVTACVNLLSMSLAGREEGKLYVGSWSDWCSHLDD